MKKLYAVGIFLIMVVFPANPLVPEEDPYNVCMERCASMPEQSKYQCVQTCVRTMKKNRPSGSGKVSRRMEECERICSGYEGVENLRCMRICLDKTRGDSDRDAAPAEPVKKNPDDEVCEKRCSMLDPSMKYECLKKCRESMKRNRDRRVNVW